MRIAVLKPESSDHRRVKVNGVHLCNIGETKGRHYWYDVHPHNSFHNTLHIPNSATTLSGCLDEIREHYADKAKIGREGLELVAASHAVIKNYLTPDTNADT